MLSGAAISVLLLLSALSGGCSTDRQVYVDLPLTRLELPEPAPRRFGTGPASGEAIRLELTPDQTTTSPDPQQPRILLENSGHLHFDLQLPAPVTIGLKAYGANLFGVHAKWSVFSPRNLSSSVRRYTLASLLCVPSQKGMCFECLQPHNQTVCGLTRGFIVNFTGLKSLPLCEPSQNG